MPLTDIAIRKALPKEKAYKLSDGRGLFLYITPKGAKSWRFRYFFENKEKLLTFGLYPEVKLIEARERTDDARLALRQGRDPGSKIQISDGITFETVANEWHAKEKPRWSKQHSADVLHSLQAEVFPSIGSMAIKDVKRLEVASLLKITEARGAIETAHRVRQRIAAVFDYAIASGYADENPGQAVKSALKAKPVGRSQPAITNLNEARAMLKAALVQPAQPITREAVLILALTAVRPGELRHSQWDEFDLDNALWTIPASHMKGDKDRKEGESHLVPLAPPVVEALRRVHRLTGHNDIVFPSIRHAHEPMSENAIGYLLNRAGYHSRQTAHGFRATFSSIMNEGFPADRAIIDLMLAHKPKDISGSESAYSRASHITRRRELSKIWADTLLG